MLWGCFSIHPVKMPNGQQFFTVYGQVIGLYKII